MTKTLLFFFYPIIFAVNTISSASSSPITDNIINKKVTELMSKMTLEEKIGQLEQQSGSAYNEAEMKHLSSMIQKGGLGSILNVRGAKAVNQLQTVAMKQSRLQIPILFGFDVIEGYRTIFPVPLAQASSWDPKLIEQIETIAAREATAAGIKWTFSPMVDIARDPRWGRIVEGAGEDPYLGSLIAAARVRGFQGQSLADPERILACAKHWVGYGAAEGGRDYNTTLIPENELRSIYFPPFKAALDAGVGSFMSAFNDLNGVPASANKFTLNKVLRQEWGFKGFVVSDWNSILETINHGYAATEEDAARMSFLAGVDMEMASSLYQKHLPNLLMKRNITEEQINRAVRRILTWKYRLGLFEQPYIDEGKENATLNDPKHIAFAKEASIQSQVLLKNKDHLLPLSKNTKSIAVIGPLANDQESPLGWWRGDGRNESVVTILKGLQQKAIENKNQTGQNTEVFYSAGCNIQFQCSTEAINNAIDIARKAEIVILVVGEHGRMSGEANSRTRLDLPGQQQELVEKVYAANPNSVVVLVNGRPLALPWIAENIPAILVSWLGGQQVGPAVADVLFGDANPSGKLTATWPRSVGQLPVYYNHKNTGRPPKDEVHDSAKYTDEKISPLFPFGFGLSYSQFKITDLKLSANSIKITDKVSDKVTVTVDVENTGDRAGAEVVQLYIHDIAASVTRPIKELKAFKKIHLRAQEKQKVEFQLGKESFSFINQEMKSAVESGDIEIFVGNSSNNLLKTKLTLID
jgi:beta-glucosidase